ncbi:hypothetical protein MWU49_12145 [Alcanivorax sp. S6407]|uniref:hypothetical protein n=1 Tax=Alcanivorax sp. S6407 TaxID=2926424 RepID=UPI001FF0EB77|nr:hypothetical protein [Alcanivorax sp. S6407]MCK0154459.1 hypothetical protein [Alcanivorax sp. S6407]
MKSIVTLMMLLGLACGMARADVLSASVNPASQGVALGRQALVSLNWQAVRDETNCLGTVTSASVEIRAGQINGPLLRTLPRRLSRSIACNPTFGTRTFSFADTLSIPSTVSEQALQLGSDRLVLVRTFTDGLSGSSAAATLALRSPAAAGFSLTAIQLQLARGGAERVIEQGEAVSAHATFYYTGSGLLQGQWELASPPGSAGVPLFRPLRQVQQLLPAGGQANLQAPPLPSDIPGLYLLRFRPRSTSPEATLPVLQYQVITSASGPAGWEDILLQGPARGAVMQDDTPFQWQPVAAATSYRLSFYATTGSGLPRLDGGLAVPLQPGGDGPVAAQWLSASQTSAQPGPLMWEKLSTPGTYLWRVEALDALGQLVGVSEWREVQRP